MLPTVAVGKLALISIVDTSVFKLLLMLVVIENGVNISNKLS